MLQQTVNNIGQCGFRNRVAFKRFYSEKSGAGQWKATRMRDFCDRLHKQIAKLSKDYFDSFK